MFVINEEAEYLDLIHKLSIYKSALEACRSVASNGETSSVIWIVNNVLKDNYGE